MATSNEPEGMTMATIDYESATLAAPPGQGGLATSGLSTKARSAGGGGVTRLWRDLDDPQTLCVMKADGAQIDIPWASVKGARRAGTGPSAAAMEAPTDDFIEEIRRKRDEAIAAKAAGLTPVGATSDDVPVRAVGLIPAPEPIEVPEDPDDEADLSPEEARRAQKRAAGKKGADARWGKGDAA